MKLFQTKAYKVIMGYIYGWGATAVIVGALFKIMHFPGAGVVLTVGMLVEAGIFFLSAFEPSMEHYDWARVFPVLGKSVKEWDKTGGTGMQAMPAGVVNGTAPVQQTVVNPPATVNGNIDLGLEAGDLDKLKAGINKIAETADNFAGIVGNAPDVAEKINKISETFGELDERTSELSKALANSSLIRENFEKLSANMGESASSFGLLSRLMEEQAQQLKTNASDYTQQIARINKNISALNALYELQIHETKDCLESFRGMQGDMGEMLEHVSLSLDSAKMFKQESQQLANNVASLNAVYGNMLSVVNNN